MMYGFRILFFIIAAFSFFAPKAAAHNSNDSIVAVDTTEVDNRPLLKRIFKNFPVVYTDTAYTAPDYVVVFKCTLMNHSWHHHSCEKMKRERTYAIPDSTDDRATSDHTHSRLVTFTPFPDRE